MVRAYAGSYHFVADGSGACEVGRRSGTCGPLELDLMARLAGLELVDRWAWLGPVTVHHRQPVACVGRARTPVDTA